MNMPVSINEHARSIPNGTTPSAAPSRRMVDAPTRVFHALFALSFLGAYLSADGEHWRMLHVTLGYTMAGLLVWRVLYGIWGPPQARLMLLWRKLAPGTKWLKSATESASNGSFASVNWRQGQNLLMALAVVALLALVVPVTLTGYASFHEWGDFLGGDWVSEVHEWVGDVLLFTVLAHLALIATLSYLRKKNLVKPMLNGQTEGPGPNLAKRNHAWLAVLLLLAVLTYWSWEWQQSPNGLISAEALSSAMSIGHDQDLD
jgi:cytochrome b